MEQVQCYGTKKLKEEELFKDYDVIVVGVGHAGCEAATAAANLGSSVLLITMNLDTIAAMSCNPAMGGVAKGQIVREIDALGGYSGIVTDKTMIQFRMLNHSKGPAMWSPRAQSDRWLFSAEWKYILENTDKLDLWQDTVEEILVQDGKVMGVRTAMGHTIASKSVILTNGTFLNGSIHIGLKTFEGGRIGENAVKGLTENLVKLGFEAQRMKTGTPVRIEGKTIDFSKLEEQKGDQNPRKFSYSATIPLANQRSCWIAYTNEAVHEILKTGFEQSPMFTGRIEGIGPRYCPSIEDKINKFSDKTRHQLFVEPEGWMTNIYYLNGFSSSLPEEIQVKALHLISGFENAKIVRPGYAIEYDFFPPTQLKHTLETKRIQNLYFAGQINGTTGYEEAAAQGLLAGINAHLKLQAKEPFILKRSEAYIGVLIDDLITKGVDEPYRMFTSRAEYRTLLRQDNADLRLTERSHHIGLASTGRLKRVLYKKSAIDQIIEYLKNKSISPAEINTALETLELTTIAQKTKLINLLLRPQIGLYFLMAHVPDLKTFCEEVCNEDREIMEEVEIMVKYENYFKKEQEMVDKLAKFESIPLKYDFDYKSLQALSFEAREKLTKIKPETLGQASRISGVSPADISVLLVYFGR